MQHRALLAHEKQTNGVHKCSAREGMDKENCKLVWTLNLYLYKSHTNANSERSGNNLFIRFFLRKVRIESCESYQNCGGPFPITTDGTQLFSKQLSFLFNCWDRAHLVLVGHRAPVETRCPVSPLFIMKCFLCI